MPPVIPGPRGKSSQLGLAVIFLVVLLAIAYGYYHPNKMVFFVGLILTIGGVLTGAIRIVTQDDGGQNGT